MKKTKKKTKELVSTSKTAKTRFFSKKTPKKTKEERRKPLGFEAFFLMQTIANATKRQKWQKNARKTRFFVKKAKNKKQKKNVENL